MSDEVASHRLTSTDFQYMDEASVHNELKCSICLQIFVFPVSLKSCGHTFCDLCIRETLKTDRKCPICRRFISTDDFEPVNSTIVINMLDQLLVQCNHCKRTKISRGDMSAHLQHCNNFIISCPTADLGCSWTGQRTDKAEHLKACVHYQIAPLIRQLYSELDHLQMQITNLQHENQRLKTQIKSQTKDSIKVHATSKTKKQDFKAQTHRIKNEPTTVSRRQRPFSAFGDRSPTTYPNPFSSFPLPAISVGSPPLSPIGINVVPHSLRSPEFPPLPPILSHRTPRWRPINVTRRGRMVERRED